MTYRWILYIACFSPAALVFARAGEISRNGNLDFRYSNLMSRDISISICDPFMIEVDKSGYGVGTSDQAWISAAGRWLNG